MKYVIIYGSTVRLRDERIQYVWKQLTEKLILFIKEFQEISHRSVRYAAKFIILILGRGILKKGKKYGVNARETALQHWEKQSNLQI